MKGITTACNGKEMTEREEKSALKHPPRHHSLTSFSVRPPPHLYSSSLDLADQFPLDIDYCYNCTILITCPLETLVLSFFPPQMHSLPSAFSFYFSLRWLSEQVSLFRKYNPSTVCVRQEVISDLLPLCDPWDINPVMALCCIFYITY